MKLSDKKYEIAAMISAHLSILSGAIFNNVDLIVVGALLILGTFVHQLAMSFHKKDKKEKWIKLK